MTDESDIIKMLAIILKHFETKYSSPSDETGVQKYPSGIISVDINNKPTYWFFDEYEFVNWIKAEFTKINNDN